MRFARACVHVYVFMGDSTSFSRDSIAILEPRAVDSGLHGNLLLYCHWISREEMVINFPLGRLLEGIQALCLKLLESRV